MDGSTILTATGPAALALQQVQAALSSMPAGSAVQQAQIKAPQLVSKESDPYSFLIACSHPMNPSKAAQKLVAYWEMRLSILGSSRAFQEFSLPHQLSQNAREILQTGLCVLLENDALGRPVLCLDFSRRLDPFSMEGYMEAAFYSGTLMMQKLQESPNLQSSFVVLLINADSATVEEDATNRFLSVLLNGGFPATLHSFHIFTSSSAAPKALKGLEQQQPQSSVRDILSSFSYISKKHPTYIHDTSDKEKLRIDLYSHGLGRDGIPYSLGGTWKYESFLARLCDCNHLKPTNASDQQSEISKNPPATAATVRDTIFSSARLQFAQAVKQIPPEESAAYTQATTETENDPGIWKEECNLDAFLKSEELHAKLAAQRMASYWKLRSESFGKNQYKRLYQTGEDALELRELTALATGFVKLLHSDGAGHPVLFIDGSLLFRWIWTATQDCCLFYMLSLACENPMAQSDGIVLILTIDTSIKSGTIDYQYLARLAECLPIRLFSIHVLSHSPVERQELSPLQGISSEGLHVHVAANNDMMALRLERFGLTKKSLPKNLKGDWDFTKFIQWQELRTRMEWRIPLGFRGRDTAESYDYPAIRPYKVLPDSEKVESRRRFNVIHCRRKRDRVRIETRNLEDRIGELKVEQGALRKEGLRLEELLQNARRMVVNASTSSCFDNYYDRRTTMEGGMFLPRCLNHEVEPMPLQAYHRPASNIGTILPMGFSSPGPFLPRGFDRSSVPPINDDDRRTMMEGGVVLRRSYQTEPGPPSQPPHHHPTTDVGDALPLVASSSGSVLSDRSSARLVNGDVSRTEVRSSQQLQPLAPVDEPICLDSLLYRLQQQQQDLLRQQRLITRQLFLDSRSSIVPTETVSSGPVPTQD